MGQSSFAESRQIAEQAAPVVSGALPLPWSVRHNGTSKHRDEQHQVIAANGNLVCDLLCPDLRPYNASAAAFIVRAVNSHEALVAALENMIAIYWADGDGELPEPVCIQEARAALASAREAQP